MFSYWNHFVALFKIEVHITHNATEDELPAGDPVLLELDVLNIVSTIRGRNGHVV